MYYCYYIRAERTKNSLQKEIEQNGKYITKDNENLVRCSRCFWHYSICVYHILVLVVTTSFSCLSFQTHDYSFLVYSTIFKAVKWSSADKYCIFYGLSESRKSKAQNLDSRNSNAVEREKHQVMFRPEACFKTMQQNGICLNDPKEQID